MGLLKKLYGIARFMTKEAGMPVTARRVTWRLVTRVWGRAYHKCGGQNVFWIINPNKLA
jgi:hypothetical protein